MTLTLTLIQSPSLELTTIPPFNCTSTTPSSPWTNHSSLEQSPTTDQCIVSDYVIETSLDPVFKAFLIGLYALTTGLSAVGNLLLLTVFSLSRRWKSDLGAFLINLALADLLMATFCMPFTFSKTLMAEWIFSAPMCPVVLFIQTLSVTASVGTITAISVDRYRAVVHPIRSRTSGPRSCTVVGWIWIVSSVFASVQLYVGRAIRFKNSACREITDCVELWPEPGELWRRTYTLLILTFAYLLPMGVITVTYGFVGCRLWKRKTPGNADGARDFQQLKSKRKTIKMLVIVVVLFGVCWLPLHLFTLVLDFYPDLLTKRGSESPLTVDPDERDGRRILVLLYYAVHWLAMSNSFVNPIVYGFFNDNFREDLRCLLGCHVTRLRRRYQRNSFYGASIAIGATRGASDSPGGSTVRLSVQDVRNLSLRRQVPTDVVGGSTARVSVHESLRRQVTMHSLGGSRSLHPGCREGTINLERMTKGQRRMWRRLKRTSAVEKEASVGVQWAAEDSSGRDFDVKSN